MKRMVSLLRLNSLAFAAFAAIAFCAPHSPGSALAAEAQPAPAQQELQDTLQNAPASQPNPAGPNPYADIPEEFIQEAGGYYNYCSTTTNMYQYYDCKCLATKYLDWRVRGGKDYPRDMILASLEHECQDASAAAGYEYEQCLGKGSLMPIGTIPIEDYCECLASTYAKLYETSGRAAGSDTFIHLKSQAMTMCQDPELEQQLYPKKKTSN